jgi:hypothetical protein
MRMDTVRGILMPAVLLGMAGLLAFLGNLNGDQARDLASQARVVATRLDPNAVAPRAQAEARSRVMVKRAHEANLDKLAYYGGGLVVGMAGALLLLGHLRMFRSIPSLRFLPPSGPSGPAH